MNTEHSNTRNWIGRAAVGALLLFPLFMWLANDPPVPPKRGDDRRGLHVSAEKSEHANSAGSILLHLRAKRPASEERSNRQPAVTQPSEAKSSKCALNRLLIADGNVPVFEQPSERARRLRLPSGELEILDPRNDIEIIDTRDGWVQLKVTPLWPATSSDPSGWIQQKYLRAVATADETACLFLDPTKWESVPPTRAKAMRATALRLLKEDKRCNRIFSGGFLGAGQKYFFDCYPNDGGRTFSYWFSMLTEDRPLGTSSNVSEGSAVSTCAGALARRLQQERKAEEGRDGTSAFTILGYKIDRTETVWRMEISFVTSDSVQARSYCLVDHNGRTDLTLAR